MLQKKTELCSWGLGLSPEQSRLLRQILGDEHRVDQFYPDQMPTMDEYASGLPCMAWISSDCLTALSGMSPSQKEIFTVLPKVLLLRDDYTLEDFEKACDRGITEILKPPFSRERILDAVRRALEAHSLHYDVHCMAREIMLERELLERKNEILGFLVNFLSQTSESLDLEQILQSAFSGFNKLMPVCAMHAAFWEQDSKQSASLSLHICSPEGSKEHDIWRETLLQHCRMAIGPNFAVHNVSRLHLDEQPKEWVTCLPDNGTLLSLPISNGTEQSGVLLLVASIERHLGRDQAMALDSAVKHLGLCASNARRFQLVQKYADYDILTKVHSRRHFESKLEEEILRFNRYGHVSSLIMLDIDHFKTINDTHGHYTGDIVLREVAELIMDSVRNTDYCARYGGEEFIIILPYTSPKQATKLAERMRKKISSHIFNKEGCKPLQLTASMGITSLTPGVNKSKQSLLCEADAALYAAKNNGRNSVQDSALLPGICHACAS